MPPSISHEGYSDKAAYLPGRLGLHGYRSAVELSHRPGARTTERALATQRDDCRPGASLAAAPRASLLDVLPGAADCGDFDPTSSTVASIPAALPTCCPARSYSEPSIATGEIRHAAATNCRGSPWRRRLHALRVAQCRCLVRLGERSGRRSSWSSMPTADEGGSSGGGGRGARPREPRCGDMPHGWSPDHPFGARPFAYEDEGEGPWCWPPACRWAAAARARSAPLRIAYGGCPDRLHRRRAAIDMRCRPRFHSGAAADRARALVEVSPASPSTPCRRGAADGFC
jgi:hypothetical protein